jgi:hypothetical protein
MLPSVCKVFWPLTSNSSVVKLMYEWSEKGVRVIF